MGGWEENRMISKDSEFCHYWLNNKRLYKLEDYKDNLQKKKKKDGSNKLLTLSMGNGIKVRRKIVKNISKYL